MLFRFLFGINSFTFSQGFLQLPFSLHVWEITDRSSDGREISVSFSCVFRFAIVLCVVTLIASADHATNCSFCSWLLLSSCHRRNDQTVFSYALSSSCPRRRSAPNPQTLDSRALSVPCCRPSLQISGSPGTSSILLSPATHAKFIAAFVSRKV